MQIHGGNSAEIAEKYDLDERTILDFSSNINPLGFPASVTTLLKQDTSINRPLPGHTFNKFKKGHCLPEWRTCKEHHSGKRFHRAHLPAPQGL